jgi:hypothetical protein
MEDANITAGSGDPADPVHPDSERDGEGDGDRA